MLRSLLEGDLTQLEGAVELRHDDPRLFVRRTVDVEGALVARKVESLGSFRGRLNH